MKLRNIFQEVGKYLLIFSIHIYDIQEKGKYYDGNSTGKICFKIRKNKDDSEFDKKINNINNKIGNIGCKVTSQGEKSNRRRT